jgi:hypothetical protein
MTKGRKRSEEHAKHARQCGTRKKTKLCVCVWWLSSSSSSPTIERLGVLGLSRLRQPAVNDYSTLCYRDFGICWARSRPGGKVRSYGAPVCFRADFAAAAEIMMRSSPGILSLAVRVDLWTCPTEVSHCRATPT